MKSFRYSAKLVIYGDGKFFGPGVAQLLENVQALHSLSKASKKMSLSFTKALKMIKTAEENLGFELLERQVGGRAGGGSKLTPKAKKLLALYRNFEDEVRKDADAQFDKLLQQISEI